MSAVTENASFLFGSLFGSLSCRPPSAPPRSSPPRRAAGRLRAAALGLALALAALATPGLAQFDYDPNGSVRPAAPSAGADAPAKPLLPEEILEAARGFERRLGGEARAILLPGKVHPSLLLGLEAAARPAPAGAAPGSGPESGGDDDAGVERVFEFLDAEAPLLGLERPREQLALEARHVLGEVTVLRFEQRLRGVKVLGAVLSAHLDASGRLRGILNATHPAIDVDLRPRISQAEALRAALAQLGRDGAGGRLDRAQLAVWRAGRGDRLVWDLWVRVRRGPHRALVDASSGVVLGARRMLFSIDCAPRPRGNVYPESPAKGNHELQELVDLSCLETSLNGEFVRSFDWTGTDLVTFFPTFAYGIRGQRRAAGVHFAAAGANQLAEVTVYQHASRFHGWFGSLGFRGLDRPLPAVANVEECYGEFPCENAFYDPSYPYAAGEGLILFGAGPRANFGLEADVIGHEYTHAVVHETSGLGEDFFDRNQFYSSSLNEAFADFFACAFIGDPDLGEYSGRVHDQTPLRDLDNDRRWPQDIDFDDYHVTGLIWAGTLWSVRQALSRDGQDLDALEKVHRLSLACLSALPPNADFLRAAGALNSAAEAIGLSPAQLSTVRDILLARGLGFHGSEPPLAIEPLMPGEDALGEVAAVSSGNFRMPPAQHEILVPEDAISLRVEVEGSGDIDLHLRFGSVVAVSAAAVLSDHRSAGPSGAESVEVRLDSTPPLSPGRWLAAVVNRRASVAGYRIRATVITGDVERIIPLASGEEKTGDAPAGVQLSSFQYLVSVGDAGGRRLEIALDGDNDVDLYARLDKPVETGNEGQVIADAVSRSPASVERLALDEGTVPALSAGSYFLAVRNRGASATGYRIAAALVDAPPPALDLVALAPGAARQARAPAAPEGLGRLDPVQYTIDVPADGAALSVELRSASDLDLYLRKGQRVAFANGRLVYDQAASRPGAGDESLEVDLFSRPPLSPGRYFLAVVNRSAADAAYEIDAELEIAAAGGNQRAIPHGTWLDLVIPAGAAGQPRLFDTQFVFSVAADAPGIDVITQTLSPGNVDLYLRRDRPVQLVDGAVVADYHAETERGAEAITVFQRDAQPGNYFIALVNRGAAEVSLGLIAIYQGAFTATVPVEEGDLFEASISASPDPPAICLLSLDQFAVEVPANALRLQLNLVPLDGGALTVLMRYGSRILIDVGDAVFDETFSTADGPVVISGDRLRPGVWYFTAVNCEGSERRYQVSTDLVLPGSETVDLFPGAAVADTAEAAPSALHGALHPVQYAVEILPGVSELVVSAWGGDCAELDIDLLGNFDGRVEWASRFNHNALWTSTTRGDGAETLVINASSDPPLRPGRHVFAIASFETRRAPFRLGAVFLAEPAATLAAGAAVTRTVASSGIPDVGLLDSRQHRIRVAPGADGWTGDLRAITGSGAPDIDLYARFALPILVDAQGNLFADRGSEGLTGVEAVRFPEAAECLRPGFYYLAVGNFASTPVEYSLQASLAGIGCEPISAESPARGTLPASAGARLKPAAEQFCIEIGPAFGGFQVDLIGQIPDAQGNIDLYVRDGRAVDFGAAQVVASFRSEGRGVRESVGIRSSRVIPGRYFIAPATRSPQPIDFDIRIRRLVEGTRVIGWNESREGAAPASSTDGIAWLAPEQFRLAVPEGAPRLRVRLEIGAAGGSALELHVRRGGRVELDGTGILSDQADRSGAAVKTIEIPEPRAGTYFIAVRNLRGRDVPFKLSAGSGGVPVKRGDANEDGAFNLTDPVAILDYLFRGGAGVCAAAADVNGAGDLNITDAVYALAYLFQGGPAPPSPFPDCGEAPIEAADGCSGAGCL
jgi:Zn-dependent metalloprotease